jgi:hypothetical protein
MDRSVQGLRPDMQYAFQIFDIMNEYVREHPETKIIFSPDWANGADVVARFFLDDFSSIQMGSVQGHIIQKLPLDSNTLFIMTPYEYASIKESPKFTDIDVETIVPYPDGNPGSICPPRWSITSMKHLRRSSP